MKVLFILDHTTFGEDFLNVGKSCAPFCDIIRYRAKELTAAQIYENAARLRETLPDRTLMLSEYADMAAILGFNGVHLGAKSMPVNVVKETFPQLTVSYAAHTFEECVLPADYVTLSPVFHTIKPYQVVPLGAVEAPAPNVYALGGINTETICQLRGLGYTGIAGISFYKEIREMRKLADEYS